MSERAAFGPNLRRLRNQRGVSIEQIAAATKAERCVERRLPAFPRRSPANRTDPRLAIEIWYDRLVRLADIVAVSRAVADTAGRLEKVGHLAELLKRAQPGDIAALIAFLS